MASIWNGVKQASKLLWQPSVSSQLAGCKTGCLLSKAKPSLACLYSSKTGYDPYPEYDDPGDPYHPPFQRRYGYHYEHWKGGERLAHTDVLPDTILHHIIQ